PIHSHLLITFSPFGSLPLPSDVLPSCQPCVSERSIRTLIAGSRPPFSNVEEAAMSCPGIARYRFDPAYAAGTFGADKLVAGGTSFPAPPDTRYNMALCGATVALICPAVSVLWCTHKSFSV